MLNLHEYELFPTSVDEIKFTRRTIASFLSRDDNDNEDPAQLHRSRVFGEGGHGFLPSFFPPHHFTVADVIAFRERATSFPR